MNFNYLDRVRKFSSTLYSKNVEKFMTFFIVFLKDDPV